jgi:hypothetical protein
VNCSKCDLPIDIERPDPSVGLGGAASCVNECCEMFDVDVYSDYLESLVDEDGNMPKQRLFR